MVLVCCLVWFVRLVCLVLFGWFVWFCLVGAGLGVSIFAFSVFPLIPAAKAVQQRRPFWSLDGDFLGLRRRGDGALSCFPADFSFGAAYLLGALGRLSGLKSKIWAFGRQIRKFLPNPPFR